MAEGKMQLCANCGTRYPQSEGRCPDCGTHKKHAAIKHDPTVCAWRSNGEQCQFPATLSHATNGEGTWWCSAHFECNDPIAGADIVNASRDYAKLNDLGHLQAERSLHPDAQAVKDRIEAQATREAAAYCAERGLDTVPKMRAFIHAALRNIGKRPGNTDWARKILDRIAAGEKLPMISEQKARLALGAGAEREPGEEG